MTRYAIGLGSNLGDRLNTLRQAVAELGGPFQVSAVSSLYETAPIGGPEQGPFLNAVVVIETDSTPEAVLVECQAIEARHGRVRAERWGARTLDLDVVATDGESRISETLTIPHPRASEREFVLRPLSEVWPEADVNDGPASEALRRVEDQGVDRLETDWMTLSPTKGNLLVIAQLVLFALTGVVTIATGGIPQRLGWSEVMGGVMVVTGLGLMTTASRTLGAALTPHPRPVAAGRLNTEGVYGLARHPIYGGVILVLTGAPLLLSSIAGAIVGSTTLPFFWWKSIYEERLLRARYPEYSSYRSRVSRRFIPYVV